MLDGGLDGIESATLKPGTGYAVVHLVRGEPAPGGLRVPRFAARR